MSDDVVPPFLFIFFSSQLNLHVFLVMIPSGVIWPVSLYPVNISDESFFYYTIKQFKNILEEMIGV